MSGLNILAYGTLMASDIMRDVSGGTWESTVAVLEGYQRRGVRDEKYPGIVRSDEGRVEGVLYLNISEHAIHRLDLFEGEMYSRQQVSVRRKIEGGLVEAMTYVVKPEYAHLLTERSWDFQDFVKSGKKQFQELYKGYDSLNHE